MDFVNDVDLKAGSAWSHGDVLSELANFVNSPITRTVDLQYVNIVSRAYALAKLTLIAGSWRSALRAIECLGKNSGCRGFAHPPRPGKEISMANTATGNGFGKCLRNMLLTDQFLEGLRSIASGNNDIFLVIFVRITDFKARFRSISHRSSKLFIE